MKYGHLAMAALVTVGAQAAAPVVSAQGLWWVEGDRYCGSYGNRARNGAMCGSPRRGETEPSSTFKYQFNSPRLPIFGEQPEQRPDTGAVAPERDRPVPRAK